MAGVTKIAEIMKHVLKKISRRFIRQQPRPTEYFVARIIAWSAVCLAVATSVGLIMAATRLV